MEGAAVWHLQPEALFSTGVSPAHALPPRTGVGNLARSQAQTAACTVGLRRAQYLHCASPAQTNMCDT